MSDKNSFRSIISVLICIKISGSSFRDYEGGHGQYVQDTVILRLSKQCSGNDSCNDR